ncbi:hypothetical protein T484DRAFT_1634474, partial [Baffinella frigidus]
KTLHPTPCTLHPAPCTLHPAPCTLHPAPCTLHPEQRETWVLYFSASSLVSLEACARSSKVLRNSYWIGFSA